MENPRDKRNVAFIGVGNISGIYLKNITTLFEEVEIAGVCDLVREKAERAAKDYGGLRVYDTMEEAFADPQVDIVLNLTRPHEHFAVTKAALLAGKHVYSEKPLAATLEEGTELVKLAKEKGLLLGGAPDTYLGAGLQTCRKLIDDGYIGEPVGAAAFMICRGPEGWHPDPEFFYKHGGGPMLDMGPYYVTALVNMMGRVKEVAGMTRISYGQRTITSAPQRGTVIEVEAPTYVTGMMRFESGAVGTIFTTFDVHYPGQARLEVYGSQGTLFLPDPNTFGGPVKLLRPENGEVTVMPLVCDYPENSRGLGLADMAKALCSGREPRAGCQQTHHVLEVMSSLVLSGQEERHVPVKTNYTRPAPMKKAVIPGILDE